MDLVAGVKTIYVITQHCTKAGEPKLVTECSYPLTGQAVVSRIYTNLAVIDVTPRGFQVVELASQTMLPAPKRMRGGNDQDSRNPGQS
jgi:3-oxoadipate CoA-transferase beta subunit